MSDIGWGNLAFRYAQDYGGESGARQSRDGFRSRESRSGIAGPAFFNCAVERDTPARLLLAGVRQGLDGVAVHPQPDPVGELLEAAPVDGDNPIAEAEEATDLDIDRLHLAVGSPDNVDDLAQVLAVCAVGRQASQRRQAMQGLPNAGHRPLAGA